MSNSSEHIQKKISVKETFASHYLKSNESKSEPIDADQGTPIEVFRNNTTAVEVIVKEVPQSRRKKLIDTGNEGDDMTIKKLKADVTSLKIELSNANSKLAATRISYRILVEELKRQMDAANGREMEKQSKNVSLELENEKLKALLEFKTNLVNKLKKELHGMKRILKFVIKIIRLPRMEKYAFSSDPEYDDFESELKKKGHVDFDIFGPSGRTFDSSVSKEPKSF